MSAWNKWETSGRQMGDKYGKQVENKYKLMRPKKPRVGDKWESSVNFCGSRHPEWETSVGDQCKLMQPKAPKVGDKCGRQV